MTQFPMPPAVAPLAEKSAAHPGDIALRKEYGAALHRHGLPERALPVFESILAADANDPHAAAACVNLLAGLSRPQAAQRMALDHRELLEQTAPGHGAMATAALGVKDTALARRHLEAALAMAPRDPLVLTRLAELEARSGDHAAAIGHLETALQLDAGQPARWANLADALTMARRDTDALSIVRRALQEFPGDAALGARLPVLYAYAGDFTAAGKALALLPETSYPLLARVLAAASPASAAALRASTGILPNPQELFTHHAFDAMRDADWRLEKQVTQVLRELIAQAARQGGEPDWRDAQFYTLLLPMSEDEQLRMRDITAATVRTRTARRPIADTGTPPPRKEDGRFHIGISTPSLLEENTVQALMAQLRLHDRGRFAFHLYSPIPSVDDAAAKYFEGVAEVVDIGHLTPREAVLRMRLDRLDLWMDLTYFTPTCRVEIPAYRVAPVQLRRQTWQRTHRTQPCEYTIGDTFTHPGSTAAESGFGHIARFPFTSWLDAGRPAAAPQPSRAEVGLPADSLVLSAFSPAAVTIDP
ncbi:MAG: tetratricopeptide repeat protein, partial [Burkholderiaceae bacterium]